MNYYYATGAIVQIMHNLLKETLHERHFKAIKSIDRDNNIVIGKDGKIYKFKLEEIK